MDVVSVERVGLGALRGLRRGLDDAVTQFLGRFGGKGGGVWKWGARKWLGVGGLRWGCDGWSEIANVVPDGFEGGWGELRGVGVRGRLGWLGRFMV